MPRASRSWPRPARRTTGRSISAPSRRIWRGGCIIRARFLYRIKEAYERDRAVPNLLLDPYFADLVTRAQPAWRDVVATADPARRRDPGARLGAGLFRRLPLGAAAGQPDPGAARLLWRPYLRARRPAGQLPHRVDGDCHGQPWSRSHGHRADGRQRHRQDRGRHAAGQGAGRQVRRGRRLPPAGQRREDAKRRAARRCRPPAVARDALAARSAAGSMPAGPSCWPARRSSSAIATS